MVLHPARPLVQALSALGDDQESLGPAHLEVTHQAGSLEKAATREPENVDEVLASDDLARRVAQAIVKRLA